MHAVSSYRGNRPTNKPPNKCTHKQTGLITIHCAAKLSTQCNNRFLWCHKFRGTGGRSDQCSVNACLNKELFQVWILTLNQFGLRAAENINLLNINMHFLTFTKPFKDLLYFDIINKIVFICSLHCMLTNPVIIHFKIFIF